MPDELSPKFGPTLQSENAPDGVHPTPAGARMVAQYLRQGFAGDREPQYYVHARLGLGRITIAARLDAVEGLERLTFALSLCAPADNFCRHQGRNRARRRLVHPLTAKGAEEFGAAFLLATPVSQAATKRTHAAVARDILGWFNRWLTDTAAASRMPWWVWQGDEPGVALWPDKPRKVREAVTE